MEESFLTIREAVNNDEPIIAEHLYCIMLELGVPAHSTREDWLEQTIRFIERARRELSYKGFIAELDNRVIGSTSCQILEVYPRLSTAYQKGYIWGVYLDPSYRMFHLKGYDMMRVFKIVATDGDINEWAANDLEMSALDRLKWAEFERSIEE